MQQEVVSEVDKPRRRRAKFHAGTSGPELAVMPVMAIHVALLLSLLETFGLAAVLLHWADRVAGARLLVGFVLGVAVWIAGNELPAWTSLDAERPALMLLATAALTSAVFLHFTLVFCRIATPRGALAAIYAIGLAATCASVVLPPGHFVAIPGVSLVAVPNRVGWVTSLVWAALAGTGELVLLRAFLRGQGLERRQIAAIATSSAWGLACMSGYAVPVLGLPFYPWPLLGLPLYPLILVYGVLRYRVLVANAWARRALGWTLLVGLAGLLAGGIGAAVPLLRLPGAEWLSGVVAAVAVLVLGGPVRRLAERVVYPGRTVSAADLRSWRATLAGADTQDALWSSAASLLSRTVNIPVQVGVAWPAAGVPAISCRTGTAGWACELEGWDAAPPGVRRLAGLFADVLAEQAVRVDGQEATRASERDRQHRDRLTELGALAATVAHDVRNPLNTIAMAVAMADADTRREVGDQVRRIARLADDLLDYATPWTVEPAPIDPAEIASTALGRPVPAPAGLRVRADLHQLRRALDNLVENARLASDGRIGIEIEAAGATVRIHVCDNGPGIPVELRGRLFQPFVSRRAGGTGLGLAIVARIMEAHGGSVALGARPGWTTCFTLTLPAEIR